MPTISPSLARAGLPSPSRGPATTARIATVSILAALVLVSVMVVVQGAGAPLWSVSVMTLVPAVLAIALIRGSLPAIPLWLLVVATAHVVSTYALAAYLVAAYSIAFHLTWTRFGHGWRLTREDTRHAAH